jgi:hypothetical protein
MKYLFNNSCCLNGSFGIDLKYKFIYVSPAALDEIFLIDEILN